MLTHQNHKQKIAQTQIYPTYEVMYGAASCPKATEVRSYCTHSRQASFRRTNRGAVHCRRLLLKADFDMQQVSDRCRTDAESAR